MIKDKIKESVMITHINRYMFNCVNKSCIIIMTNKIIEPIYLSTRLSIHYLFFFYKIHVRVNQTRYMYNLTWVVRVDQTTGMS